MGKIQRKKSPDEKRKSREKAAAKREAQDNGKRTQGGALKGQPPAVATKVIEPKGPKFLGRSVQFLREVRIELKKVTWPSRKQTMGSTAVVIVFVLLVALFLGVTDKTLSSLVWMVLH